MAERTLKYFDNLTGLWTDFTASDTIPATAVPAGGGGITDHGALTGLADDDHPQYLTEARAAVLFSPVIQVFTLASDQATGANTTPVTLSGLVFNYEANCKYRIWAMGRVQPTAATTGCGFQFDLSSAVTSINTLFYHQLANTGTLSGGHSIADDASVGVSSGMPGTSTYPVNLQGLLITGANAGTAQLRFRAEVAAVTTCKAGFTLVIEKIEETLP